MPPLVARTGTRHRSALHEAPRRHARDRARYLAVVPTIPIATGDKVVVDRDVVDARDIGRAGAIDRPIHIARAQRIPGHPRPAADADRRAHATDESDHRWRIVRPHRDRPRHPSPAVAEVGPTPIVRRREAPRRVVDPGPAPGRHPGPVARTIGRPTGWLGARKPHRAIARVLLPVTIVVQRGIARHIARNITRRYGLILARVARGRPLVEAVGSTNVARTGIREIGTRKAHPLPTAHFDRTRVAIKHGGAVADRHLRRGAVGGNVEPVVTRLTWHKRQIGCINLHLLVGWQRAHAQLERALCQFYLRGVIVEVQHPCGGAATQSDRSGAGVKFRSAARIDPDPVASGHWPIQADRSPFVGARRSKTEAAGRIGYRGNARGRVRRLCSFRAGGHSGSALPLLDVARRHVRVIALSAGRCLREQRGQAERHRRQRESCMGLHVCYLSPVGHRAHARPPSWRPVSATLHLITMQSSTCVPDFVSTYFPAARPGDGG